MKVARLKGYLQDDFPLIVILKAKLIIPRCT